MSNIFLKNNIKKSFNLSTTEQSISLPKHIVIKNITNNDSVTSSALMGGDANYSATSSASFMGRNDSATSSASFMGKNANDSATSSYMGSNNSVTSSFMPPKQMGGANFSTTSNASNIKSKDINQLISMLTSESEVSTATNDLENKLKNKNNHKMIGGSGNGEGDNDTDINTELLENKLFNYLNKAKQQKGGNSMTPYAMGAAAGIAGTLAYQNYSEQRNKNIQDKTNSKESVFIPSVVDGTPVINTTTTVASENLSTSTFMPPRVVKGTDDRLGKMTGGGTANPALKAFAELSKMVSLKLEIPNGPKAKKIAGQVQRDIKAKNPDIKLGDIIKTAKELLEKTDKYKKMIEV
jgi:hypothetical protein